MRRRLVPKRDGPFALCRVPCHFQHRAHLLFQHLDPLGLIGDHFGQILGLAHDVGKPFFEIGDFVCIGHSGSIPCCDLHNKEKRLLCQ